MTPKVEFHRWIDIPVAEAAACPVCLALGDQPAGDHRMFIEVDERAQPLPQGGPVRAARCANCASVWFPEVVFGESYPAAGVEAAADPNLQLLIDHYTELVGGLEWRAAMLQRVPLGSGSRVIEIGCNVGILLDYLHRVHHAEVIGLEPSVYGLIGKSRFGLDIRAQYMAEHLGQDSPADPPSYDVVIATEVIEHVPDPLGFLVEIHQLVAPGGVAIMTTPNPATLGPERTAGELYAALSVGSHQVLLSPAAFERLARQAGFTNVQLSIEPVALVAILSDRAPDVRPAEVPRHGLLAYYSDRAFEAAATERRPRTQLADLISRYCLARELGSPDANRGEERIDELLRSTFAIDVTDLRSFVEVLPQAHDVFAFVRLGPTHLARYLFWRGQRDDISEQVRTELWETAVALIGRGLAADPVNLFMLQYWLGDTLTALHGRPDGRFRGTAIQALADAGRDATLLTHVQPRLGQRVRSRLGGLRRR